MSNVSGSSGRALRGARLALLALAATCIAESPYAQLPDVSLGPMVAQSLAPVLAAWIVAARDSAKEAGVEPIPSSIREALAGYVPDDVLERVSWREDGEEFSMPQTAIRFGDVPAMTLDDVVVFQERQAALEDPKLWAHELKHVMQFAEWGVQGFAMRYLQDYEAVEAEAAEFRWQFMKQAGLIPPVPHVAE